LQHFLFSFVLHLTVGLDFRRGGRQPTRGGGQSNCASPGDGAWHPHTWFI